MRARLLLPIRNRDAFLQHYFSRGSSSPPADATTSKESANGPTTQHDGGQGDAAAGDAGGLFIPGELDVAVGDEVDVELHFIEEQVRFHIRACVKWKRAESGRRTLPQGVGIAFLASEARTQQQVVRFAQGHEDVHHVARDRRWALGVDVRIVDAVNGETSGFSSDISEGGCFVLTTVPLPVGARVDVKLKAPGALLGWLTLPAYVAWRREGPHRHGVGVEFVFESDRKRDKVRKLVHALKERLLRDVHVARGPSVPPPKTGQNQ